MANVRDFEYITAIAQYGSISKASEALFLSQPTLSKFLQRVEKELGLPLFHRVGKRFILTSAGEIYVARSRSILELEHLVIGNANGKYTEQHEYRQHNSKQQNRCPAPVTFQ